MSSKIRKITKKEYNGKWPFTFNKAIIIRSGLSIFVKDTMTGNEHALNGVAARHKKPLEEVWLEDKDNTSRYMKARIDITPFIEMVR